MTLQASGAISLADLRDEFGDATGSVSFARYYAGTQGEVPPQIGSVNPNIPVSGSSSSIALNDFYGAQNFWEVTITEVGSDSAKFEFYQGFTRYGGVILPGSGAVNTSNLYNLDGQLKAANYATIVTQSARYIQISAADKGSITAWTTATVFNPDNGQPADKYIRTQLTMLSAGSGFQIFDPVESNNYRWTFAVVTGSFGPYTPTGSSNIRIRFENNG